MADTPQPDRDEPIAAPDGPAIVTVARRPVTLVLFFAVVVLFLGGDLWLKAWSFERIATVPLRVTTAPDGPSVWLPYGTLVDERGRPVGDPDEPWVLAPRANPRVPASAIPRHEPTVVVPGLLNMQLTLNTGAVFGLGQGARWLFIVVSVLATGVILVLVWKSPANAWVYHAALGMILAGALGNLYDRVRFSAARDMLHMLPTTNLWPWIFNLADVALVVGVLVVLGFSFLSDARRSRAERAGA